MRKASDCDRRLFPIMVSVLEYKSESVFPLLGDLVFLLKHRATGMGANTAHSKVNTNINEIVLF